MTALRERYQFFSKQFQSTSLFLHQLISDILKTQQSNMVADVPVKDTIAFRESLIQMRTNDMKYNMFYQRTIEKYPHLPRLLEMTCNAYVEFTVIGDLVTRTSDGRIIPEPLHQLFIFLLHLYYVKPVLLMVHDDVSGTYHEIVKESLLQFIIECIVIKHIPLKIPFPLERKDEFDAEEEENISDDDMEEAPSVKITV
jgi:hypothetical protein